MKYTRFEDLPCWQKARELCRAVYRLIQRQQFSRDYSLKDQVWRAAGSAMDNVAAGFDDLSSPLKYSQLLRRCKKFKLSRMNNYFSTMIRLPGRQIENVAQPQPVRAEHRTCPVAFFAPCTWG